MFVSFFPFCFSAQDGLEQEKKRRKNNGWMDAGVQQTRRARSTQSLSEIALLQYPSRNVHALLPPSLSLTSMLRSPFKLPASRLPQIVSSVLLL
jgi:hypothetical protein